MKELHYIKILPSLTHMIGNVSEFFSFYLLCSQVLYFQLYCSILSARCISVEIQYDRIIIAFENLFC